MPVSLQTRVRSVLVVGLLGLACASPLAAQAQGKFKWWQSDRYKTELMLTTEQSKRLEEIFQNALPALRAQMKTLETAETELEPRHLDCFGSSHAPVNPRLGVGSHDGPCVTF